MPIYCSLTTVHDGPVSHLKSSSIMVREPSIDLSLMLEPDVSELEDAVYCSGTTVEGRVDQGVHLGVSRCANCG
jgi:hypothetical protein